jgi:hypothetical protein
MPIFTRCACGTSLVLGACAKKSRCQFRPRSLFILDKDMRMQPYLRALIGVASLAFAATVAGCGERQARDLSPVLEGMDVDRSGVRDDIERFIQTKYTDPKQRRAALQTARAFQRMLLVDKHDVVALEQASNMGARALNCRATLFPGLDGIQQWTSMSSELEALTANTPDRRRAYSAYNKARSGTVSGLLKGDTCE